MRVKLRAASATERACKQFWNDVAPPRIRSEKRHTSLHALTTSYFTTTDPSPTPCPIPCLILPSLRYTPPAPSPTSPPSRAPNAGMDDAALFDVMKAFIDGMAPSAPPADTSAPPAEGEAPPAEAAADAPPADAPADPPAE